MKVLNLCDPYSYSLRDGDGCPVTGAVQERVRDDLNLLEGCILTDSHSPGLSTVFANQLVGSVFQFEVLCYAFPLLPRPSITWPVGAHRQGIHLLIT